MAQKVNIILVDDIDGSDATETISFGLDGASYEIDLNDDNAAALREALAPYVGHARKLTRGRAAGRRAKAAAAATVSNSSSTSGASAADIRAWARDNGYDVPARGRVPADIRQAYEAAN